MDNNNTNISIQFKNSVTNLKRLQEYEKTLEQINGFLNGIDKAKAQQVNNYAKSVKNVSKSKKKASSDNEKLAENLNLAFDVGKVTALVRKMGKLVQKISKTTEKSATYLENLNLLDVAFQNNTKNADKLVNTLSEMYGLDESWGYRTVGIFKQLSNAMGLSNETGTKLSKTLTQLAIDTSSLYNIDTEDTVSILQSALSGQTKPARRLGADITQNTLQLTLDTNGIEKAVNELSYAEKRLLIVASITQQTNESWGDWGRTIESVANQMRIFKEQTERLSRAIGNLFLPMLKAILPYLNAILMVLTEIIQWIATLVGYNEEEFDFFGSSDAVVDFADDIANLGGALDDTYNSAKKLQTGLRSFDKLNNIKTPTASSGNVSGEIGAGGISPEILDLFNKTSDSYLNSLDKVQMKATEIRDKIMEWLGFTKVVDEETGKVSFKFDHITGGTVLGAMVVGGTIYSGIKAIGGMLEKIGLLKFSNVTGLLSSAGKVGLTIGSSLLVAEGISIFLKDTEFGQGLDMALTGGAYKDEDFLTQLGKIPSETTGALKDLEENVDSWDYEIKKAYANWQNAINIGMDEEFIKRMEENFYDTLEKSYIPYEKNFYFQRLLYGIIKNPSIQMPEEYNKNKMKYLEENKDNLLLQRFGHDIFNRKGKNEEPNITEYTQSFTEYIGKLKESYDITSSYKQIIEENQSSFDTATNSLENVLKLLKQPGYNASVEDINEVTNAITTLASASTNSYNAMYDGVIKVVAQYHEQGLVSDEETERIISNLEKQKLAQEGKSREFINQYTALKQQLENNLITQEQFTQSVINLYNEYGEGNTILSSVSKKWEAYGDVLMITASSYDELSNSFTTAQTEYSNTAKELETQTNNTKAMLAEYAADMKEKYGETSQEYKDAIGLMVKADENKEKSMATLNENYAKYLASMLKSLVNSGQLETDEGKKLAKNLNTELGKIGYGIDLGGNIADINNQLDKIGNNVDVTIPVNVDTNNAEWSIKEFFSRIKNNYSYGAIGSVIGLFGKADGGVFKNGKWQDIQQYALGGLPQHGSVFVAGERGAEIVGHINGQTEVLNQSQMAGVMRSSIIDGLKAFGGSDNGSVFNFYLDADHKLGSYTLDRLKDMARSNGGELSLY